MSLTQDFVKQMMDYINHALDRPRRLILGGGSGEGGGTGYPPGGIDGQLPQIYICYDTTEGTTAGSTSTSGCYPSLVQNLNRIRGGWAIGDEAIQERHMYWSTGCLNWSSGCIGSQDVPFWPVSTAIEARNVRDAIEETYAYAESGGEYESMWMEHAIVFSVDGDVEQAEGQLRFRVPIGMTAGCVTGTLYTAPAGQNVIIDVHLNGASMLGPSRLVIASGGTLGMCAPSTTSLVEGDIVTMDVDQVGSTTPGSSLVVEVCCKQYLHL